MWALETYLRLTFGGQDIPMVAEEEEVGLRIVEENAAAGEGLAVCLLEELESEDKDN